MLMAGLSESRPCHEPFLLTHRLPGLERKRGLPQRQRRGLYQKTA